MLQNQYVYTPKHFVFNSLNMKRNGYTLLSFFIPFIVLSQSVFTDVSKAVKTNQDITFYVKLNVFLEGPFNGSQMLTDLNKAQLLPLDQPFNTTPWNYDGTESVATIPNGNIVDWVYVEIRSALWPDSATSETTFGRQAAFLLNSGKIVSTDGVSNLAFDTTYT